MFMSSRPHLLQVTEQEMVMHIITVCYADFLADVDWSEFTESHAVR